MVDTRPVANRQLEMRLVGDEVIVHDPVHGKIHVLNRSAAFVLERCDGRHTIDEIAHDMSASTGARCDRVRRDVGLALESFAALRLLVP